MTGGGQAWTLGPAIRVHDRLRLIGFCSVMYALGGTSGLQLQGYLLTHKNTPRKALEGIEAWVRKTRHQ